MGRNRSLLLVTLALFCVSNCFPQESFQVPDPTIELKENLIHIYYDILNSLPSDQFIVNLDITDSAGNKIVATALEGDIGKEVGGGRNKHVTWDLEVDEIVMKANIYFEITARRIEPPPPDPEESETITSPGAEDAKSYNRTGIILQSVALPGLGLTRVSGKPHWLKSVAGYGCIAGSILLNQAALRTYDQIDQTPVFNDKRELLDKSIRQDNSSEGLAYAAIGIWVADFIWTLVETSSMKNRIPGAAGSLYVKGSIDQLSFAPLISVSYRF
jgi:hypothetical protein